MFKTLTPKFALAAAGLAAAVTALPAAAEPLPTWYGRYVWEEPLGRVGGNAPSDSVAIFVTRTLTLGPVAGNTGCRLDAEGYQTNEQMLCTATPEGASVVIKFYTFRPDGRYPSGTKLFTMTRTAGGGLATRLQALRPTSDATPPAGRFFRRAG